MKHQSLLTLHHQLIHVSVPLTINTIIAIFHHLDTHTTTIEPPSPHQHWIRNTDTRTHSQFASSCTC